MNTLKKQRGFLGFASAAALGAVGTAVSAGTTIAGLAMSGDSGNQGQAGYQASQKSLRRAGQQFSQLKTPGISELQARLEQAVFVGELSPIQAVAMLQRETEMAGIEIDPRAAYGQLQSLEQLSRTVEAQGMTPEDKSQLFASLQEQDTAIQGARGRYGQSLAERGLFDQAAESLERSVAGQTGANRQAQVAMQAAADAESRMQAATQERGRLAGQFRTQSFGEQQRLAEAQDRINQFNTQTANRFEQDRAAQERAARDYNVNTRQQIADLNVGTAGTQAEQHVAARQQDFQNRMAKARGRASALGTASGIRPQQTQSNLPGALLGTVGTLASGLSKHIK